MKEKSFKFKESYGKAIETMTDKQAGQLLKCLCGFVFDSKSPTSSDSAVKGVFTLIKTAIEAEQRDRENGRKGGLISAERNASRHSNRNNILVIADTKEECAFERLLHEAVIDSIKNAKTRKEDTVAKT